MNFERIAGVEIARPFASTPLHSILPSSQARAASARDLKNRAAHSHLSILIRIIASHRRLKQQVETKLENAPAIQRIGNFTEGWR